MSFGDNFKLGQQYAGQTGVLDFYASDYKIKELESKIKKLEDYFNIELKTPEIAKPESRYILKTDPTTKIKTCL